MSNAFVYRTAANRERMAARDLDRLGIAAIVPIDRSGKRAKVTMPGYFFPREAVRRGFSKHVLHQGEVGFLGVVPEADLKRMEIQKEKPQTSIETNPFAIGQAVMVGEVSACIAGTDGPMCSVAVTMLGKTHLKLMHYSRLRPG